MDMERSKRTPLYSCSLVPFRFTRNSSDWDERAQLIDVLQTPMDGRFLLRSSSKHFLTGVPLPLSPCSSPVNSSSLSFEQNEFVEEDRRRKSFFSAKICQVKRMTEQRNAGRTRTDRARESGRRCRIRCPSDLFQRESKSICRLRSLLLVCSGPVARSATLMAETNESQTPRYSEISPSQTHGNGCPRIQRSFNHGFQCDKSLVRDGRDELPDQIDFLVDLRQNRLSSGDEKRSKIVFSSLLLIAIDIRFLAFFFFLFDRFPTRSSFLGQRHFPPELTERFQLDEQLGNNRRTTFSSLLVR